MLESDAGHVLPGLTQQSMGGKRANEHFPRRTACHNSCFPWSHKPSLEWFLKNQLYSCLTRMSGSCGLTLAKKLSALPKSVFQLWHWGTSICFSDSLTTLTMDKATTRVSKAEQAGNLTSSICSEGDDFQVWRSGVVTSKLSFDQMVGD